MSSAPSITSCRQGLGIVGPWIVAETELRRNSRPILGHQITAFTSGNPRGGTPSLTNIADWPCAGEPDQTKAPKPSGKKGWSR